LGFGKDQGDQQIPGEADNAKTMPLFPKRFTREIRLSGILFQILLVSPAVV
jgi:hypothetical protein